VGTGFSPVVFTGAGGPDVSVVLFRWLTGRRSGKASTFGDTVTLGQLSMIFLALRARGDPPLAVRPLCPLLSNGLFNFIVMQTLFYLPFLFLAPRYLSIRA
jgi:glucan biosynthesis protein C